jgi:hypothetical protein
LCCQQGMKFMHVFFILYRVYAVPIFRTIR